MHRSSLTESKHFIVCQFLVSWASCNLESLTCKVHRYHHLQGVQMLFFKVGKFYELYEEDAAIAYEVLGYKVTVSGVGRCR